MKKIMFAAVVLAFFATSAFGRVVYVSSFRTAVYAENARNSQKVLDVVQGDQLQVISVSGDWYRVRIRGREGWIQSFFVSERQPDERVSVFGTARAQGRIHARQRASSDVTAASARGLLEDADLGGRARVVDTLTDGFDSAELEVLERLVIEEAALIAFLEEGGIR